MGYYKLNLGSYMSIKNNCEAPRDYDQHLYKSGYIIEKFFTKLKQ